MRSRSQPLSYRHARGGFTLLELSIAMTFVALLAGGIVITISTCLNVWARADEAATLNQEARAVLQMIGRDLRDAYLGLHRTAGYFIGTPAGDRGRSDALELSTHSSAADRSALLPDELRALWAQGLGPPLTDFVGVRYVLREASEQGPAGLYRELAVVPVAAHEMVHRQQMTWMKAELLSTRVRELRFRYYDGQDWWTQWDSELWGNRLPQAVAVAFIITDERGRAHTFRSIVPLAAR